MSPSVTVDPASTADRALIEGMFQFYVYDFAEMYGPDPDFDVGPDGRYGSYLDMDSYWRDADRRPFVVRADGRAAGFVLLNTISHRRAVIDHAVAEFFVMRPFRRSGVGATAAKTVFTRFPGRWELAIAAPNEVGRCFWPKVVAETPGASDIETHDLDASQNNRRILSFTVAQARFGPTHRALPDESRDPRS